MLCIRIKYYNEILCRGRKISLSQYAYVGELGKIFAEIVNMRTVNAMSNLNPSLLFVR